MKNPTESFHKKNDSGEYVYSNLSGVVGIFDSSLNEKSNRELVFFKNPYVNEKMQIPENILKKMRLKQFQIDFELEK